MVSFSIFPAFMYLRLAVGTIYSDMVSRALGVIKRDELFIGTMSVLSKPYSPPAIGKIFWPILCIIGAKLTLPARLRYLIILFRLAIGPSIDYIEGPSKLVYEDVGLGLFAMFLVVWAPPICGAKWGIFVIYLISVIKPCLSARIFSLFLLRLST